jgi:FkbM family methyltransferase
MTVTIRGDLRMTLPPGFPPAQSYQDGDYEPQLTAWFIRTVRPGWTIVDAGANIGYYTLLASRAVGPSGRVFAFEPDPTNFEYLLRNIELNQCRNVHPLRLALSDHAGIFSFRRDRFRAEGHLVEGIPTGQDMISVESVRLDSFLEKQHVTVVHLMKFDIEGGEPAALRGVTRIAAGSPGLRLVIEYNRRALMRAGSHESELFAALRTLGFTRARSLEVPGREIRVDLPVKLAGPTQNLEVWR